MAAATPRSWFHAVSDWLASPGVMRRLYSPGADRAVPALAFCRRILVLKLDEIGDFVLATPFLRELRANAAQAHITLIVKPSVLNLAETCPWVDRVFTYDGQTRGQRAWQLRRQLRAWRLARSQLRQPRADLAIIPRWGEDAYNATCLAAMARPRAILAWSESATAAKQAMNAGFDALVSHPLPPHAAQHEVEHNLSLLHALGATVEDRSLAVWPTATDRQSAKARLPDGPRWVALAPGALDPRRRWPVDRFAALADRLAAAHGLSPVVLGAADDPALPGALDLRGRTTLREAAAVLERCVLFVGNDSGLKHLAAAEGLPVVELSAFRLGGNPNHGNSPDRFRAWGVPTRVLQPPPGADLLAGDEIGLPEVEAACDELLREAPLSQFPPEPPSADPA